MIVAVAVLWGQGFSATAQGDLFLYTNNLVNGFQDWSFGSTRNFANPSPVQAATNSISVTINNSGGALSLQFPNSFDTTPYASLSFWINGGTAGGQGLKVYGTISNAPQMLYALPRLETNIWQQFTIPLTALGVASKTNCSGIWIESSTSGSQPVYYVDNIEFVAAPAPAPVHVAVDATQTIRPAMGAGLGSTPPPGTATSAIPKPARCFSRPAACPCAGPGIQPRTPTIGMQRQGRKRKFSYTSPPISAPTSLSPSTMAAAPATKPPPGSNPPTSPTIAASNTGKSATNATAPGKPTPTRRPHDPYTYAVRAAGYIAAMKAADPTIKVGVVAVPGEDNYANNTNTPVVNPRTGATHYGWTPVMLARSRAWASSRIFLIHHVYPEYTPTNPTTPTDSDALLLQVRRQLGQRCRRLAAAVHRLSRRHRRQDRTRLHREQQRFRRVGPAIDQHRQRALPRGQHLPAHENRVQCLHLVGPAKRPEHAAASTPPSTAGEPMATKEQAPYC